MSEYLNPGNVTFGEFVADNYVDKTGILALLNHSINSDEEFICMSRPRRFGKSVTADMMCAYYCKGCDSRDLFQPLAISADSSFDRHLNKYDVFYIDIAALKRPTDTYRNLSDYLNRVLTDEIKEQYPEVKCSDRLIATLRRLVEYTGNKIIMIIDEWDAPIRENPETTTSYLDFLRELFKNGNISQRVFALVFMTGIMPIIKSTSQSSLSNFIQYSALYPGDFGEFFGFTKGEVRELCRSNPELDFQDVKFWYDGYHFGSAHSMYNPYAVINALEYLELRPFWVETCASETLKTHIRADFDGLQERIMLLTAGKKVKFDPSGFSNSIDDLKNRDDVFTLLVHLGYLTQEMGPDPDEPEGSGKLCHLASIPNEEVRQEFKKILKEPSSKRMVELLKQSEQLVKDTESCNADGVAKAIQKIHDSIYSPTFYNNEQALRSVIRMAYISCEDRFARVEELPTGHGIADVAYVPKKGTSQSAIIVELKWNVTAEEALSQIKAKDYTKVLLDMGHDVILVGIGYEDKTKAHACKIEFLENPAGTP